MAGRNLKKLEHLPEDDIILGAVDTLQRQIVRLEEIGSKIVAAHEDEAETYGRPNAMQMEAYSRAMAGNAIAMSKVCDTQAKVRALSHGPNQLLDAFVLALSEHVDPSVSKAIVRQARAIYEAEI